MKLGEAIRAVQIRWPEWRAALAWIVHSWRYPPNAPARWEQQPERSWWE